MEVGIGGGGGQRWWWMDVGLWKGGGGLEGSEIVVEGCGVVKVCVSEMVVDGCGGCHGMGVVRVCLRGWCAVNRRGGGQAGRQAGRPSGRAWLSTGMWPLSQRL